MQGLVHSIDTFSTLDGPGIRTVIFMQGCPLRCQYCQNPDTWSLQSTAAQSYTAEELMKIVRRSKPYWAASGGGVTVSGGEPLLQAGFVEQLFSACRAENISTALDTSLYVNPRQVQKVLSVTDLFLADIKHMDAAKSRSLTGLPNRMNIENLRLISQNQVAIWIRYVIIPGLTDQLEDLAKMAELAGKLTSVAKINLLPYHALGVHKWTLLSLDYQLAAVKPPSTEHMNRLARLVESISGKPCSTPI